MKSFLRFLAVVFLLFCAVFFVFVEFVLPEIVAPYAKRFVKKECASCGLDFERLRFHCFPPGMSLTGAKFYSGSKKTTFVDSSVGKLDARLAVLPLFEKRIEFNRIIATQPRVEVIEGDGPGETKPKGEETKKITKPWTFAFHRIEANDGSFTYIREHKGVQAPVEVRSIYLTTDAFGNTPELKNTTAIGRAQGMLEESGKFDLVVQANIFAPQAKVSVDLHLVNQVLSQVRYFEIHEKIALQGKLAEGRGHVDVAGQVAKGRVFATYDQLNITILPKEDRSNFASALQNLLADIKLAETNKDKTKLERARNAEIHREHDETVIAFILRALKEAAMEVASK